MKKFFLVYGAAYLLLLVFLLGLQFVYPKLELHMLLNSYHTRLQDLFFKYYSMMAEGPLYVLALLPILWKQVRMTVFFAVCELTGGGLLQILKHLISMPRPQSAFESAPDMVLPVVEGVSLHSSNSFPSGHASTFFVFFTCLALFLAYRHLCRVKEHKAKPCVLFYGALLFTLLLAALGAYSRVYLSQHFLSDVCMGSVIGFLTPCLMFYFLKDKILKLKTKASVADGAS